MTAPMPDPDEVMYVAERARSRMLDLEEALAAITCEASSPEDDVHAVVDGRGALIGLDLTADALRRPARELGRVVVETAEAAARDAFVLHADLVEHHLGDGTTRDRAQETPDE